MTWQPRWGRSGGSPESKVSRICAELDKAVEAFRSRPLDHTEFPCLFLDVAYLKVRNSVSQVTPMAMVIAAGAAAEGRREILGCDIGNSEDGCFWQQFPGSLKGRGLAGVGLVTSELAAASTPPPGAPCKERPGSAAVCTSPATWCRACPDPTSRRPPRCAGLSSPTPDAAAVRDAWDQVADQLAARFPKTGEVMARAEAEVLAFADFPKAHWHKIRAADPLERINKEIKRRSRAAGN